MTHEVLVTTGSTPAKIVQIEPVVDHHTTWKYVARRMPDPIEAR
jgi:hypothetical protein